VKVTELTEADRKKSRADWEAILSALALGKTLLLSDISIASIYGAAKRAGVKVHASKREDGYVVWLWEK
jgi:hypothetical protein